MSHYSFGPFSNRPVDNAFSRKTLGPTGLIGHNNGLFNFLKSSPYSKEGAGGNTYDPVNRQTHYARSMNFRTAMNGVYDHIDKTKRQIRYNEFTRSGSSLSRPNAFDFATDYNRLEAKVQATEYVKYIIAGAIIYYVFIQ